MRDITVIDMGDQVLCDWCGKDYTNSDAKGGFMFGFKATCPSCAPKMEADAKKYDEEHYIRARCPADLTFREWVLRLRNGDNRIIVTSEE